MAYSLATHYAGQSLISGFNFVSIADPTEGFIAYQSYANAVSQGLVSVNSATDAVTLKVDTTNTYNPDGSQGGRPSVRLESKVPVNQGLLIGDFAHMPGSTCGAWPAFWMYGPNWPNSGEIDIIEGANQALQNLMSGHTGPNCNLPTPGSYTGTQKLINCTTPNDANGYDGCNYVPPTSDTSSYGDGFNAIGGGVYAVDWTSSAISIWHFPRGSIPQDIVNKAPVPSTWGTPQAVFGGGSGIYSCDVASSFSNMSIVLNIDLCGQYAGTLWGVDNSCKNYSSTCEQFVGDNPSQLTNLYWEVNYIDVYAATAAAVTTQTSTSTISVPTIPYPTGSNSTSSIARSPTPVPISTSVPGSVSTTTPTVPVSPSDSIVPVHDPASIGTFAFLGCFSSSTSYVTFDLFQTSEQMVPELCVSLCSGRRFAGVYNTGCYCADVLDAGTSALPSRDSCNLPCPGNANEFCGGLGGGATAKRQLLSDVLLTLYGNMAAPAVAQPAPAPGQGASSPSGYYFEQVIVSTVTYTDVCSTDRAKLVTSEYCTTFTVTHCPWSNRHRPTKEAIGHSAMPETKAAASHEAVPETKAAATKEAVPETKEAVPETKEAVSETKEAVSETEEAVPETKAAATKEAGPVTKATTQPTTVPMTAVTHTCNGCGPQGESVVTLTQPEAVVVALTKLASVSVPAETEAGSMPVQVAGASRLDGLSAVLVVGMALAGALLLG